MEYTEPGVKTAFEHKLLTKTIITTMKTTITTEDFYLAAYLMINDIPLTGHSRLDNKSTFTFEGDNLEDFLNSFYQEEALVSPMNYARGIRSLKALMYNNTTFQPTTNYDYATRKEA